VQGKRSAGLGTERPRAKTMGRPARRDQRSRSRRLLAALDAAPGRPHTRGPRRRVRADAPPAHPFAL